MVEDFGVAPDFRSVVGRGKSDTIIQMNRACEALLQVGDRIRGLIHF